MDLVQIKVKPSISNKLKILLNKPITHYINIVYYVTNTPVQKGNNTSKTSVNGLLKKDGQPEWMVLWIQ